MLKKKVSRRKLLRLMGLGVAGTILAACQPEAVEKEVTKEVEKIVKETVEVEKEVTRVVEAEEPTEEAAPVGEVPREKTLIIGFEGESVADPEQANPLVPGSRVNQGYHQCMIESLYYLDYQTGDHIPWLAAGQPDWNEDYSECTVPIREGIEWSDGEPFTAEDVAYTINMLREPGHETMSYGASMQKWVEECDAPDATTLHLVLNEPNPRFFHDNFSVRIWGAFRIVPKHIFEDRDPMTFKFFDMDKGWPIWTGPYKLVKASTNEFIYDRRDDWWAAKTGFHALPEPERIVFIEAGDDDKKAAMLERNEVDGQPSLSFEPFETVRERNPHAIGWTEDAPYAWFDPCPWTNVFHCEVPPWDDPEMRWAVVYAVDDEKLAKTMGGGHGIAARFQFPPYPGIQSYLDENEDILEEWGMDKYDPARAKEIIESKGYAMGSDGVYRDEEGEKLSVNVLATGDVDAEIMFTSFLRQVGIDAEPQIMSVAAYHDEVALSQFEFDPGWSYCGSVTDPWRTFDSLHKDWIKPIGERHSYNEGHWSNDEFSEISDEMGLLPPGDERLEPLFRRGLEIFLKEMPIYSISQQWRVVPYSTKYWTNWPTEENDYVHPPNWWMTFHQVIVEIEQA